MESLPRCLFLLWVKEPRPKPQREIAFVLSECKPRRLPASVGKQRWAHCWPPGDLEPQVHPLLSARSVYRLLDTHLQQRLLREMAHLLRWAGPHLPTARASILLTAALAASPGKQHTESKHLTLAFVSVSWRERSRKVSYWWTGISKRYSQNDKYFTPQSNVYKYTCFLQHGNAWSFHRI